MFYKAIVLTVVLGSTACGVTVLDEVASHSTAAEVISWTVYKQDPLQEIHEIVDEGFTGARFYDGIQVTFNKNVEVMSAVATGWVWDDVVQAPVETAIELSVEPTLEGFATRLVFVDTLPKLARLKITVIAKERGGQGVVLGETQLNQAIGDVDGSGTVSLQDLAFLLSHFGLGTDPLDALSFRSDAAGAGVLNLQALAYIQSNFGAAVANLPVP